MSVVGGRLTSVSAQPKVSWAAALGWRLQRQLLDPVGEESVAGVVRRLGAVPSFDDSLAELGVRLRRTESHAGELLEALGSGEVVKAFAFRGAMHYLSPEEGGAYLAIRAANRQWELKSWQEFYQLRPADWPAFREAVRDALADGPLTITELGAAVTARRAYRHLRPVFDDGAGTLIKPLCWQGDLSFGLPRDGHHTFQRLDDNPRWAGVWDLDEAGPFAVKAYLRSYGPATRDHVHHWLGAHLSAGRKRLDGWFDHLLGDLASVDVEGETAYVVRDDLDPLLAAAPSDAVRLAPGHDQWVMAPGTQDIHIVPPDRRTPVTRKANLVLAGGVVAGTWAVRKDELLVTWLDGAPAPERALADEAGRLAAILEQPLRLTLE
jgi:hypothetical protein